MVRTNESWEDARGKLIARWQEIVGRIDERDEGSVVTLASVMDEFCDEADQTLRRPGHDGIVPGVEHRLTAAGGTRPVGEHCLFCRGFMELGGCYGTLDRLNAAVFAGNWAEARRIAVDYIARLQGMSVPLPGDPSLPLAT